MAGDTEQHRQEWEEMAEPEGARRPETTTPEQQPEAVGEVLKEVVENDPDFSWEKKIKEKIEEKKG